MASRSPRSRPACLCETRRGRLLVPFKLLEPTRDITFPSRYPRPSDAIKSLSELEAKIASMK